MLSEFSNRKLICMCVYCCCWSTDYWCIVVSIWGAVMDPKSRHIIQKWSRSPFAGRPLRVFHWDAESDRIYGSTFLFRGTGTSYERWVVARVAVHPSWFTEPAANSRSLIAGPQHVPDRMTSIISRAVSFTEFSLEKMSHSSRKVCLLEKVLEKS